MDKTATPLNPRRPEQIKAELDFCRAKVGHPIETTAAFFKSQATSLEKELEDSEKFWDKQQKSAADLFDTKQQSPIEAVAYLVPTPKRDLIWINRKYITYMEEIDLPQIADNEEAETILKIKMLGVDDYIFVEGDSSIFTDDSDNFEQLVKSKLPSA